LNPFLKTYEEGYLLFLLLLGHPRGDFKLILLHSLIVASPYSLRPPCILGKVNKPRFLKPKGATWEA